MNEKLVMEVMTRISKENRQIIELIYNKNIDKQFKDNYLDMFYALLRMMLNEIEGDE